MNRFEEAIAEILINNIIKYLLQKELETNLKWHSSFSEYITILNVGEVVIYHQ